MNESSEASGLRMHANYERLINLADARHSQGREPDGISDYDIGLARLYCYAFRSHVIGAFHATLTALEEIQVATPLARCQLARARDALAVLSNRSMDSVGEGVRVLLSTFYQYATQIRIVVGSLRSASEETNSTTLGPIRDLFVHHMEKITCSNGLYLTQDTCAHEGASLVVPTLGITIVPLVYGDHHSWNVARLDAGQPNVPFHFHQMGVEIHLGFSPMHGDTVLADTIAEVTEGYAMPIPPQTRHGYINRSSLSHHVPFIFGSLVLGGWGVFADVRSQSVKPASLKREPISSSTMNRTVLLEREIEHAAKLESPLRYAIIPPERTDCGQAGGLELFIVRVPPEGFTYNPARFCAVSVVRGKGALIMMNQSVDIAQHDHFGIPSGMTAKIVQSGDDPLVLLDAVIRRADA